MLATGKITPEPVINDSREFDHILGFEYSGISITGRRVTGLNQNR